MLACVINVGFLNLVVLKCNLQRRSSFLTDESSGQRMIKLKQKSREKTNTKQLLKEYSRGYLDCVSFFFFLKKLDFVLFLDRQLLLSSMKLSLKWEGFFISHHAF